MQLKSTEQTDFEKISDRVFAAMETGNFDQARTIITEYAEYSPQLADTLSSQVVREYGVRL